MENKIHVAEAKINGEWLNLKTTDGKEIGVKIDRCPKIKAQHDAAQAKNLSAFELECKVSEKNGKLFAWDLDEKKGGGGAPKRDEGVITYLSCASTAAQYYHQRQSTKEDVYAMAEELFLKATSKSTLKK